MFDHMKNLKQLKLDVTAILGTADLTMRQLLSLSVGDILTLRQKTRDPIAILVNRVKKFEGTAGLVSKSKAVLITTSETEDKKHEWQGFNGR